MKVTHEQAIQAMENLKQLAQFNPLLKLDVVNEFIRRAREGILPNPCVWKQDDEGGYATNCGKHYYFIEGNVAENNAKFCPFCGGSIAEEVEVND